MFHHNSKFKGKSFSGENEKNFHFFYFRFPTLFFVPMNNKISPIQYDGDREVDDFIKYIAKHSTNPLSGFTKDGKVKASKAAKSDL